MITFKLGETVHTIPRSDAAILATELRAHAAGHRGGYDTPDQALMLAQAIEVRLSNPSNGPISLTAASIETLHSVLNTIVFEIGPAMKLYNAIDMARRAAPPDLESANHPGARNETARARRVTSRRLTPSPIELGRSSFNRFDLPAVGIRRALA